MSLEDVKVLSGGFHPGPHQDPRGPPQDARNCKAIYRLYIHLETIQPQRLTRNLFQVMADIGTRTIQWLNAIIAQIITANWQSLCESVFLQTHILFKLLLARIN